MVIPRISTQLTSRGFVGLARGVFRYAAGALLAIALTVGALDWLARQFDHELRRSGEVVRVARQAYELALDRESAIRGYLLTRDSAALVPELVARLPLSIAVDSLAVLTANDPAQSQRTGTIRAAITRWANTFAFPALREPNRSRGERAELVGNTLFETVRWSFMNLLQAEEAVYHAQQKRQEWMRVFADVAIALELLALLAVLIRVRRRTLTQATALAHHEARARAVIEHAPDVLLLVDGDGTVRYHSPSAEALMGRAGTEIAGANLKDGVHARDRMALERAFTEMAADQGRPHAFVCRVRHAEGRGSWRIIEARGTNLLHDPAVRAIVINARDVSDRVHAEEKAREAQLEVLARLAAAGEARDDDTGQHTRRVGELAARIAQALELSCDEVELIRLAAPLHDVGKIGIPDSILRKPVALTAAEFAIMQRHTLIGAEMLADGATPHIRMAEMIARSHHEWWNGGGYPHGLAGEAIPFAARIVAVADVYDALTHARPYRRAWKRDKVIAELRRKTGTHFEPRVVQALLEIVLSEGAEKTVWSAA